MSHPLPPALGEAFAGQIAWCERLGSPFMVRLLQRTVRLLEQQPQAAATLHSACADPVAGLLPLRWAAALHDLALQGEAPWTGLWPPADGGSDAALDAALAQAWEEQAPHIERFLAHPPQTNEVRRGTALLAGLLHIHQACGLPLRLMELGASAGLNLWCDHWRHDAGAWAWGRADAPVRVPSEWRGAAPAPWPAALPVAARSACDLAPPDLRQAGMRRRLQAYVWADQTERKALLARALEASAELQTRHALPVQRADALDFCRAALAAPPGGQCSVVFHSVVWQYLAPVQRQQLRQAIEAAGARASTSSPLAWLSLEHPGGSAAAELRCQRWPGGHAELLATVHSHGAWVDWRALPGVPSPLP